MSFDRKYLVGGLTYAMAGMALGVFMGPRTTTRSTSPMPTSCWSTLWLR